MFDTIFAQSIGIFDAKNAVNTFNNLYRKRNYLFKRQGNITDFNS